MSQPALQVTFVDGNPKHRARAALERVLAHGTKRLRMACCFATTAGLKILKRYLPLIGREGSFAVFSSEYPTDLKTLGQWMERHPGHIFVHYGKSFRRAESSNTRELMHSKLFYADDGETAKVWCGSHNLTGSALQGRNIEAANVIEGPVHHPYFAAILTHLDGCRQRAYEEIREEPDGTTATGYVLELEVDDIEAFLREAQAGRFIQFSPYDDKKQDRLTPGLTFYIQLHPRGALRKGKRIPPPIARVEALTTGTNLTPRHAVQGTKATYSDIALTISEPEEDRYIVESGHADTNGPINSAIRITGQVDTKFVLLPTKPASAAELDFLTLPQDSPVGIDQAGLYADDESVPDEDIASHFKDTKLEARLPYLRKRLWVVKWRLDVD